MFSQNSRIIPNSYLFSIDTNPFFFLTVLYNVSKSNIKVVFSNVLNIDYVMILVWSLTEF